MIEHNGSIDPSPNPQIADDTYEMDTDVCVSCRTTIQSACDVFGGFCLTCWHSKGCPRPPNVPDAGRWPPGYNLQRDPPQSPRHADASALQERERAEFERQNEEREPEEERVRQKNLKHDRERAEERERGGLLDNSESANVRRMHQFADRFHRDLLHTVAWERAREINALDLAPMRSLRDPPHLIRDTPFRLPPGAMAAEEDDPEDTEEEEDESEDASEEVLFLSCHDEAHKEMPASENDAMTDESVSATPVVVSVPEEVPTSIPMAATPPAATVPAYMVCQSNVDVNKRRRTTEEGDFEEEIRSGLVTEVRGVGSIAAEMSATDWVGEINSDVPYVARGISLQPHPDYTGPTPWYLIDWDTGSTPP